MNLNKKTSQSGFSLIELSIVLVIIGLLIVGILAGRDLIKSSRIQSTITRLREFDTAVSTFRGNANYNYQLPGDFNNAAAVLPNNSLDAYQVNGDGDGILEDANGGGSNLQANGEIVHFWQQLSAVGLLSGANFTVPAGGGSVAVGTTIPRSPLGRNGIGVYNSAGKNFYEIGFKTVALDDTNMYENSLTTDESRGIDAKIDDGAPTTGIVIGHSGAAAGGEVDGSACVTGTAPNITYNLSNTGIVCELGIKMND